MKNVFFQTLECIEEAERLLEQAAAEKARG